MQRDFARLRGGPFDLLVIGGGIYGGWVAYDAALRGLRVALVEQRDWASGTSSASSKLIHGGLRYLEQGRLSLVRRALRERRTLHALGAHRVRPLLLALPVYRGDRAGRLRLRAGLWLYERLAGRDQPVPPYERLDRHRFHARYPFVQTDGLVGGFTFGDCRMDDARFALEIVAGAIGAGVAAVNHAPARALLYDSRRVQGALIEDGETGETLRVEAAVTVNCTGPWCNRLIEQLGPHPGVPLRRSRGVHLVLPPLPTLDGLFVLTRRDARVIFLLPWYGRTLVGTTDSDFNGDPGSAGVTGEDVTYLLDETRRVLGDAAFREGDVISAFAGVRTLRAGGGSTASVTREWSLAEPLPHLLTPIGGKYTSARTDAARTVERALQLLERDIPCPTGRLPLPWAPAESLRAWGLDQLLRGLALGLDEATATLGLERFGTSVERLYERIGQAPGLARRIVPDAPFCAAELFHAIEHEMARTLEDVLVRRVPLARVCRLDAPTLAEIAALVGGAAGWTDTRRAAEIAAMTRLLEGPDERP